MKTAVTIFVLCAIVAFVHSTPTPQNVVPAVQAAVIEATQIPAAIPAAVASSVASPVSAILPETPVVPPMIPTTKKPTGLFGSFLNAAQSLFSTGINAAQKVPATFATGVEDVFVKPIQNFGK